MSSDLQCGYSLGEQEPPPVHPVPDLRPMTAEVWGKSDRLEPSQLDGKCISLDFPSPANIVFTRAVGEGMSDLSVGSGDGTLLPLKCLK